MIAMSTRLGGAIVATLATGVGGVLLRRRPVRCVRGETPPTPARCPHGRSPGEGPLSSAPQQRCRRPTVSPVSPVPTSVPTPRSTRVHLRSPVRCLIRIGRDPTRPGRAGSGRTDPTQSSRSGKSGTSKLIAVQVELVAVDADPCRATGPERPARRGWGACRSSHHSSARAASPGALHDAVDEGRARGRRSPGTAPARRAARRTGWRARLDATSSQRLGDPVVVGDQACTDAGPAPSRRSPRRWRRRPRAGA